MGTVGLSKFIKNYTSLIANVNKEDLSSVVRFCALFQSDSVDLYNKFQNSKKGVEDIISIYAERYELDSEKDIEKIMYIFIQNTVNEGVVYHLNSSANLDSILELGLGTSSIGIKTPERQDYEKLQKMLPENTFNRFQPFHGEKEGSKLYYSCKPILSASYGKMPEWIGELKRNDWIFDYPDEFEVSDEARIFIDEIINKYDKKYSNGKRMLFLLPFLADRLSEEDIEGMLAEKSPIELIQYIYSILQNVNKYYTGHVSPSNILAIDLDTCNIHLRGRDGEKEEINIKEEINSGNQLNSKNTNAAHSFSATQINAELGEMSRQGLVLECERGLIELAEKKDLVIDEEQQEQQ